MRSIPDRAVASGDGLRRRVRERARTDRARQGHRVEIPVAPGSRARMGAHNLVPSFTAPFRRPLCAHNGANHHSLEVTLKTYRCAIIGLTNIASAPATPSLSG